MATNSLYQIHFRSALASRESVYSFCADHVSNDSSTRQHLLQAFHDREKVGSTQIAEHVVMPHIESSQVDKSQIIVIRTAEPIQWEAGIEKIQLVIVLLLKQNESATIKKELIRFTRTLADEDHLNELLETEEEAAFINKIIPNREESQ
ncbi:PTS sugar transporter subunit IIA [Rossellomorea marisflavi]|uniref:PTS sugar transporter subunit IIA n=1 Tax=Rossellomorea marisflavi TaxID=189381 RepID=UPI00069DF160|nr:PTS sugar transporter subunit IIA [Rossellomorea marisflavi]